MSRCATSRKLSRALQNGGERCCAKTSAQPPLRRQRAPAPATAQHAKCARTLHRHAAAGRTDCNAQRAAQGECRKPARSPISRRIAPGSNAEQSRSRCSACRRNAAQLSTELPEPPCSGCRQLPAAGRRGNPADALRRQARCRPAATRRPSNRRSRPRAPRRAPAASPGCSRRPRADTRAATARSGSPAAPTSCRIVPACSRAAPKPCNACSVIRRSFRRRAAPPFRLSPVERHAAHRRRRSQLQRRGAGRCAHRAEAELRLIEEACNS